MKNLFIFSIHFNLQMTFKDPISCSFYNRCHPYACLNSTSIPYISMKFVIVGREVYSKRWQENLILAYIVPIQPLLYLNLKSDFYLYLQRTSIAWTCWIDPHGSGRIIWHLYSPVSSAWRSETCSVLLGSILIRGGDLNSGLLESATSWFSHHHRTVLYSG
jgi:hypothetical protein